MSTTTGGDIYLGTDTGAGLTWSSVLTAGGGLYGVDCPSTSECFAVGSSGRVFGSTDAGSSWALDGTVPGTPTLLSVSCPTTTVCYANEAAGAVHRRRADGSGWDQVATNPAMPDVLSPYTEHLSCPSVDTCYQAGTLGQIMKTTDGGSSWQPHLTSSDPDLYAISCASDTRCIAVGVLASQFTGNGGADWQQDTMGHIQYSVTWASLTAAFAGGSGSVPYRFDATGILGLAAPPGDVLFPGPTLTGRDEVLTRVQTIGIDDQSGTGAGWSVSVTSTTFTSGSRTLPEHATRVMAAPANSCVGFCTLAVNTVSYPYTMPAGSSPPSATKVFTADTGSGQGRQDIGVTWSLTVPASAYIGEYTSTWTFTLGSGP